VKNGRDGGGLSSHIKSYRILHIIYILSKHLSRAIANKQQRWRHRKSAPEPFVKNGRDGGDICSPI